MIRKIISLKYWIFTFKETYRFLLSAQVPWREKLFFAVPVLLYWVLPDLLPFLPVDDAAFTMLLANWFLRRMKRKYAFLSGPSKFSK